MRVGHNVRLRGAKRIRVWRLDGKFGSLFLFILTANFMGLIQVSGKLALIFSGFPFSDRMQAVIPLNKKRRTRCSSNRHQRHPPRRHKRARRLMLERRRSSAGSPGRAER